MNDPGVKKGQVLVLVFLFMLLSSILLGGAAMLWQSGVQSYAENRDSLLAFYAALAGIEKSYLEAANIIGDGNSKKTITYDLPGNNLGDASFTIHAEGRITKGSGKPGKPYVLELTVASTGICRNSSRVITRTDSLIELQDSNGNHYGWFKQGERNDGWSEI